MRLKSTIRLLGLVVAIVAALSGGTLGVSQSVVIRGFAFAPPSVTIAPGEAITWQNLDAPTHTATSDTGAFADTGPIATGASKTVTFANAGTYAYHCAIHPSMKGTITVQAVTPTPVPPTPVPRTPVPTAPPTPVPTPPPAPTPTAPSAAPTSSPTPSASASPAPTATATTARPSLITLASASPTAAVPPQGSAPAGPGPLLAVVVVVLAAGLAGLAIFLYRRR